MKTVTLPIEEYEELVQEREDKKRLLAEMDKNPEERCFIVRYITHIKYPWNSEEYMREKKTLVIYSKDKVLADAQAEIERLSNLCEELSAKVARLTEENNTLRNQGFFACLLNKIKKEK